MAVDAAEERGGGNRTGEWTLDWTAMPAAAPRSKHNADDAREIEFCYGG